MNFYKWPYQIEPKWQKFTTFFLLWFNPASSYFQIIVMNSFPNFMLQHLIFLFQKSAKSRLLFKSHSRLPQTLTEEKNKNKKKNVLSLRLFYIHLWIALQCCCVFVCSGNFDYLKRAREIWLYAVCKYRH